MIAALVLVAKVICCIAAGLVGGSVFGGLMSLIYELTERS